MRYVVVAFIALAMIALVVFSTRSPFDESKWYGFEEGVRISDNSGKPMFVFISSKTCPICSEFKKYFSKPGVMEEIEKGYVPVFVEYPRDKLPVSVSSFPTFCVGFAGNLSCFHVSHPAQLAARMGWQI